MKTHIVEVDGETIEVHVGSGNVFEDLELEDAGELTLKSDLAERVARAVRSRGLTPKRAADLAGLAQTDLSDIVNGRVDGISIERLFLVLNRLGYSVQVQVDEEPINEARTVFKNHNAGAVAA